MLINKHTLMNCMSCLAYTTRLMHLLLMIYRLLIVINYYWLLIIYRDAAPTDLHKNRWTWRVFTWLLSVITFFKIIFCYSSSYYCTFQLGVHPKLELSQTDKYPPTDWQHTDGSDWPVVHPPHCTPHVAGTPHTDRTTNLG